VFEAVSRAASHQPDIIHSRMAIQNKAAVGSLLVLAHARLDERSIFHRRKSGGDIFANALQRRRADDSFAVCGIERFSARVVGHLEAAAVAAGMP